MVVLGKDRSRWAVAVRASRGTAHPECSLAPRALAVRREQISIDRDECKRSVQYTWTSDGTRRARSKEPIDVEPHTRCDDQSRLRAGRGRSRSVEPLGVRDFFPRETTLLRRRTAGVQLRKFRMQLLQQRRGTGCV